MINRTEKFTDVRSFKASKKIIAAVAIAVVAVVLIASSLTIVPAGKTGVVLTMGKVSDRIMTEGLNFKAPFVQNVKIINNKIQVIEIEANAVSKDLQTVSSSIAVNYRIGFESSASIYKNIGQDYETIILLPAVKESVKAVTAKYTAEQLITKRNQVGDEIKEALESKVNEYGVVIEKFNIVNFDFSAEFNAAIEAKQVAEQNLIKTQTEQEQEIVIAEAEAKKKVIAANAEAEATQKKAAAQAKANEVLTKSISDRLIEYEKIQKWNGELPKATGGNAIIDIRDGSTTSSEEKK
ncbi:MAG: prohibitin family protein [Faecalibacterium sp.]|nr:prohibitin family protein [Ruminococcus sp.]MCM1391179.1 prohibitin family protein [Ruminococcus sp.]MCM1485962.1 prohibitin family protein [Faecalibacterium sp.]